MTVFRVKSRAHTGLCVLAGMVGLVSTALAQDNKPLRLTPLANPPPAGQAARPAAPPSPVNPAQAPAVLPAQPTPPFALPAAPPTHAFSSAPLAPPALDGAGVQENDPVFGGQKWQGTERVLATALIARLPDGNLSRPLALIQTRLLAHAGEPPIGAALPGAGQAPWLSLRLAKLAISADGAWLDRVLAGVPAGQDDSVLAGYRLDQLLLAGRTEDACALAEQRVSQDPQPSWRKTLVACQSLAGDHAKAALGLQLLQEQKIEDAALSTLVERLSGIASVPWPKDLTLTPLSVALMRKGRIDPPAASLRKAEPRLLAVIARSDAFPWPTRVMAAERAAQLHALPLGDLAGVYAAVSATANEINADAARRVGGARGRALAVRAVREAASPAVRMAAVTVAAELARKDDLLIPLAGVLGPVLAETTPAPDALAAAPDALRLLLLAGRLEAAQAWLDLLRRSEGAEAARATLLVRLAEPRGLGPVPVAALLAWASAEQGRGGDISGRLALMYGVLEALGDALPARAWSVLGDLPTQPAQKLPGPAPLIQLQAAAEGKRPAETTALALILRGGRGAALEAIITDVAITRALRTIGLESEARGLALETAILAGL